MTTKRALKLLKKVLLSILADIRGCEREEEICKMFVLVNFGITEQEYDEIMGCNMENENKNLTKALDKYATSRRWSKSLDPCCVVKDKYGAVLYQYDKHGNFVYFYDSIEEYERCICHLN